MEHGQHTVSFQVDQTIIDHVNELAGYARDNGLKVSDGLLVRAALLSLQRTPEFLGVVRARKQHESDSRKEKRRSSAKEPRG